MPRQKKPVVKPVYTQLPKGSIHPKKGRLLRQLKLQAKGIPGLGGRILL